MDKKAVQEANKAARFVAEMRSNLALMDRSRELDRSLLSNARREAVHNLECKILNYPPSMVMAGLRPDMSFVDKKQVLRIPNSNRPHCPYEEEMDLTFSRAADANRRGNWMWRVGSEACEMSEAQWFPYFVTLTLDPNKVQDTEAFWRNLIPGKNGAKGKTPLQWYLRKLTNVVCKELGHKPAHKTGVSQSEYLRYVAVIEHGKSRKHHHLHGLFWLRAVPPSWRRCPNRNCRLAKHRIHNRCRPMEALWPYSTNQSPCKFFRHTGDVWSKLGFINHLEKGKPFKISPPMLAGVYLGKYMKKEDKEWAHRVKSTRNLGLQKLMLKLFKMRTDGLLPLTWRPRKYGTNISLRMIHSIPSGLLRRVARQVHFCKVWESDRLDCEKVLQKNSAPYLSMLESVRDGLRISRMPLPALYEWVTKHLPEEEGYCEKRLLRRHKVFQYMFPPGTQKTVATIPGLDHGLT